MEGLFYNVTGGYSLIESKKLSLMVLLIVSGISRVLYEDTETAC